MTGLAMLLHLERVRHDEIARVSRALDLDFLTRVVVERGRRECAHR